MLIKGRKRSPLRLSHNTYKMIVQYFILNVLLATIATAAVVDTEPPVFTDCPKDIMIDDNTITDNIRINWKRPTATDNSGVPPSVTSNRQAGALFPVPSSFEVLYKAIDAAGNEATCTFRITLKRTYTTYMKKIALIDKLQAIGNQGNLFLMALVIKVNVLN
ncbi:hypothetical protein OS493_026653 [Desmophyllum pertusum]|uniref:HYR domain-containing protein n=1 Tax=Desmophyllum pertusum TaxID=174260 RepID=A0A9X0CFH6_9CNID|nr:hypothetical protein OS493_026653 [Desmophyllum pertusum]